MILLVVLVARGHQAIMLLVARGHLALMFLLGEAVIGHYHCSFLLLHAVLPISLCLLFAGPTLTLLI